MSKYLYALKTLNVKRFGDIEKLLTAFYCVLYNKSLLISDGHLYWSDQYYDTVTQCDLDGNNCVLFVEDKGADISDIKTDGIHLYITGFNRG